MKSKTGYRPLYYITDHEYLIQEGFYAFLLLFGHKIKITNFESFSPYTRDFTMKRMQNME